MFYFDELINYDSFLWNEMLALFEFLEATGFGVEWLALHADRPAAGEAGFDPDTAREVFELVNQGKADALVCERFAGLAYEKEFSLEQIGVPRIGSARSWNPPQWKRIPLRRATLQYIGCSQSSRVAYRTCENWAKPSCFSANRCNLMQVLV